MNVFFDHQSFSLQNFGGISRYFTELITGINNNYSNNETAHLSILFSDNAYLKEKKIRVKSFVTEKDFFKKIPLQYRINKLYSIYEMRKCKYDVFHSTYYDPYFVDLVKKRPTVATFFDMVHEKFSHLYPGLAADKEISQRKKKIINSVDKIICISEATKSDIIQAYGVDDSKIAVIHLGSSISNTSLLEAPSDENFYLYVGRRDFYKNFVWLVENASCHLKRYNIKLICAGGGSFNAYEIATVKKLGLSNLVKQIDVDDKSLEVLYLNATAMLFPSLYEGFGLPILEAFSCSCPCVISNTSSLPEVAGDAALYFDPYDGNSLNKSLETIVDNILLRKDLVNKGFARLKMFSWGSTVEKTLSVYNSIL